MIALLRKEWRENRYLVFGFLVLAPLLSFGLKALLVTWPKTNPIDSMLWFMPPMLLLFVLGIAADLVAGDAGSGRSVFYAALPVRTGTIWTSKALFLLGMSVAFLAYLVFTEMAILSLAGKDAASMFQGRKATQGVLMLIPITLAGAGTFFFSTMIDRGLAAVFAALAVLTGIGFGVYALDPASLMIHPKAAWVGVPLLLIAFLTGSFVAFTKGRIHLGARLRRVTLAAVTFCFVLGLPAGWFGVALAAWRDIDPEDPDLTAVLCGVDPSGHHALVVLCRRGEGPLGSGSPQLTCAMDLDDLALKDLSAYGKLRRYLPRHPAGERVYLWRDMEESLGYQLQTEMDLATGKPLKTVAVHPKDLGLRGRLIGPYRVAWSATRTRVQRADGEWIQLAKGWKVDRAHSDWGIGVRGPRHERAIRRLDSEERIAFPPKTFWSTLLLPPTPAGSAVGVAGGKLVRFPLGGPTPHVVADNVRFGITNRDGKYGVTILEDGAHVLRAFDAAVLRMPGPEIRGDVLWVTWADDDRQFVVVTESTYYAGDALHPERGIEDLLLPPGLGYPWWFDGRRLLFEKENGEILLATKGTYRQILPRKEAE